MNRTLTRLRNGALALAMAGTLAACSTGTATMTSTSVKAAGVAATANAVSNAADAITAGLTAESTKLWADNVATHAKTDDADYDAAKAIGIDLAKPAVATGVTVSGATVTISAPGTYVLTGTLADGQVVVDSAAQGKVRLVLAGASITNSKGAAIVIKDADEAVLVLKDGTTNTVADGSGYDTSATDAPNAAIFSMADLTIGGGGELIVKGNTADGIASKDGLVILAGTITVTAQDDGVRGKDYVIVEGGSIIVDAKGDAVTSTNVADNTVGYVAVNGGTLTVKAGDDGIHAEGDLLIRGGTVTITQSVEGLEGYSVTLAGGTTTVTASDDGVNVSDGAGGTTTAGGGMAGPGGGGPGGGGNQDTGQYLIISGGTNSVSSGGDGLDSNGRTIVTGGTTTVYGPTSNGDGALDSNGGITVTGGTLLAGGSAGMAEAPSAASTVGWVSVRFSSTVAAGQSVQIKSGDQVLASYQSTKAIASLVVAAKGITNGQTYDVYVAGTKTGTVTAGQHTGGGFGGRP